MTMERVRATLREEMQFFALTSDIWTSLAMDSFMSLTIHYLTKDFKMKEFTLMVRQLSGRHTGDSIRATLSGALDEFNLDKDKMAMMLRDNGSNMVKACEDWGIPHFGCIGHCLHLIVGPFLLETKSVEATTDQQFAGSSMADSNDIDEEDDSTADYDDDDEERISNADAVRKVSAIVNEFRRYAKSIKHSVVARAKLATCIGNDSEKVGIILDVKTRWNSVFEMLQCILAKKEGVNKFLSRERDSLSRPKQRELPVLDETKWATIQGLVLLLKPFYSVTKLVSGCMYPTFVHVLPQLRLIKRTFSNPDMFNINDEDNLSTPAKLFLNSYRSAPGFGNIVQTLDRCREILLDNLLKRFGSLDISTVWTPLLDPRYLYMHHLSDWEKVLARRLFQDEVTSLVRSCYSEERQVASQSRVEYSELSDEDLVPAYAMVDSPSKPPQPVFDMSAVNAEIQRYLNCQFPASACSDPLEWWNVNRFNFPMVAIAARKWLGVCATSTPSERVFSDCGLAVTAKRSRLAGNSIESQVLIRRNMNACGITVADIHGELANVVDC